MDRENSTTQKYSHFHKQKGTEETDHSGNFPITTTTTTTDAVGTIWLVLKKQFMRFFG